MAKVYIPHSPKRFSRGEATLVDLFDFSDAERFGKLNIIEYSSMEYPAMLAELKNGLADFERGDFLVAVGDPIVIAATSAILFSKFQRLDVLKWDRLERQYQHVEVVI